MLARFLLFIVGVSLPIEALGAVKLAGYPIGVAKVSAAMLVAYAALLWVTTGRRLPGNATHLWAIAFLVFLTGLGGASSAFQGTPTRAVLTICFSYVMVVLFYFVVAYVVTTLRDMNALLVGIVVGCVTSSVVGLVMGAFAGMSQRFEGTTSNPNMLAYNMSIGLPIAMAFFLTTPASIRRLATAGAIGAIFASNVLSLSRSGFLAMGAMWGLWALRFRRLDTLRYAMIPIVLAAALSFLAPQRFWDRMGRLSPTELDEEVDSPRWVYGYWGFVAFARNPITGVGLGRIPIWVPTHGGPAVGVPHNAYLLAAAETGVMGLIPLLALTWLGWRHFSIVWRVGRRRPWSADPVLSALAQRAIFLQIAYLGAFVFSHLAATLQHKLFWCLLGLSSATLAMARERVRVLQAEQASAAVADPVAEPMPAGSHAPLISH